MECRCSSKSTILMVFRRRSRIELTDLLVLIESNICSEPAQGSGWRNWRTIAENAGQRLCESGKIAWWHESSERAILEDLPGSARAISGGAGCTQRKTLDEDRRQPRPFRRQGQDGSPRHARVRVVDPSRHRHTVFEPAALDVGLEHASVGAVSEDDEPCILFTSHHRKRRDECLKVFLRREPAHT